jgi:hypothetical protein
MIFIPVVIGSTIDTRSGFETKNPILASGAFGLESDTQYYKIGDGETRWNDIVGYNGNLVTDGGGGDTPK